MPLVATLLHRALGVAPMVIEQPELVVAEGSMLAGSAEIPVTAEPAPGPATGVIPRVPGFDWQPSAPISGGPQSGAGQFGAAAAQPGAARPGRRSLVRSSSGRRSLVRVSLGWVRADRVRWRKAVRTRRCGPRPARSPRSPPRVPRRCPVRSGVPMSAPPSRRRPAVGGYPAYPASAPPGNYAGSQATNQQGGFGVPASRPAGELRPSGVGAAGQLQPAVLGAAELQPALVSAAGQLRASPLRRRRRLNQPRFGAAGQLRPADVRSAGDSVGRRSPRRRTGRPGGSSGRGGGVPVSPEPSTRYDEHGSPVRPGGAQQRPGYRQPAGAVPRNAATSGGRVAGAGGGDRSPVRCSPLLVLVLLIATPVVAGYVSFYLTAGHWPSAGRRLVRLGCTVKAPPASEVSNIRVGRS